MRATLILAVLGCVMIGCGGQVPAPLPGPVVLPTTSIWGDEPPRAGRVDITITSKGQLFVGHTTTTLTELSAALIAASGGVGPTTDHTEDHEVTAELPVEKIENAGQRPSPIYTRVQRPVTRALLKRIHRVRRTCSFASTATFRGVSSPKSCSD